MIPLQCIRETRVQKMEDVCAVSECNKRKEEGNKTVWREGREGGRERRGCSG